MATQSWIIGSNSDCQLVVENTSVSGQHCRLTSDNSKLTLEDLNSTNGTFVNGARITAPHRVIVEDHITLGQTELMPWPSELKVPEKSTGESAETYPVASRQPTISEMVITIGRGSQNDVVLNESNVSTQHARLSVSPDLIILEDLGSTNGTSVSSVENKVHRAEIEMGDTIFFGSVPYRVTDLIKQYQGTHPPAPARAAPSAAPTNASSSRQPWIVGGIATAAILLMGWMIFGRTGSDHTLKTAESETSPNSTLAVSEDGQITSSAPKLSSEERIARSLFVIVASDRKRETPFRVGTAFAFDSQHVATSANVILSLRDLQQQGYPDAFLYCPATKQELKIDNTIVHSGFQSADQAAKSAISAYDSILKPYAEEPPPPEKLESVKSKLIEAQERAFLAIEEKTTHDVGVITTIQPLKYWLTSVSGVDSLRPNLKLSVRGLAHDVGDASFNPLLLGQPDVMASRVRQVSRISSSTSPRLLAKALPEQRESDWIGSPVLNSQGEVVAIYSRPTPPVLIDESADLPETFDAPLFDRVRECTQFNLKDEDVLMSNRDRFQRRVIQALCLMIVSSGIVKTAAVSGQVVVAPRGWRYYSRGIPWATYDPYYSITSRVHAQAHFIRAQGEAAANYALARERHADARRKEIDNWEQRIRAEWEMRILSEKKKLELNRARQIRKLKYLNDQKWKSSRIWEKYKNHPELSSYNIRMGTAHNFLMSRLAASALDYKFDETESRYGPEALRELTLDDEWLGHITLTQGGYEFPANQAVRDEINQWPYLLRWDDFDTERTAYEAARQKVVRASETDGEVDVDSIEQLQNAQLKLSKKFYLSSKVWDHVKLHRRYSQRDAGLRFLAQLDREVKRLQDTGDIRPFQGRSGYDPGVHGQHVISLLTFMNRNGIKFAKAKPGSEFAYHKLFVMMRAVYLTVAEDDESIRPENLGDRINVN